VQIILSISEQDSDPERVDAYATALREDLLTLDVDDVTRSATVAPPGSKAVDGAVIGTLVLTLATSPELLAGVAGVVSAWLRRNPAGRTAEVVIGGDTIKLTGLDAAQQNRLIDEFHRVLEAR